MMTAFLIGLLIGMLVIVAHDYFVSYCP